MKLKMMIMKDMSKKLNKFSLSPSTWTKHSSMSLSWENLALGREDRDDQANHLCSWSEMSDCASSLRVCEICDRKLVKARFGQIVI